MKLYQLSVSHFCEKARWALDFKQQQFETVNLLIGPHALQAKRLTKQKSCLPILVDGDKVIQESGAIIDYLDDKLPIPRLTPEDKQAGKEAREWEAYLDTEIGVTIRAWIYFYLLPETENAKQVMLHAAPDYGHTLYRFIFPKIRQVMTKAMNINEENKTRSERRWLNAIERINGRIQSNSFPVGDSFSRADLTACALLSPLFRPAQEIQSLLPEPIRTMQEKCRDYPAYDWVNRLYQQYR